MSTTMETKHCPRRTRKKSSMQKYLRQTVNWVKCWLARPMENYLLARCNSRGLMLRRIHFLNFWRCPKTFWRTRSSPLWAWESLNNRSLVAPQTYPKACRGAMVTYFKIAINLSMFNSVLTFSATFRMIVICIWMRQHLSCRFRHETARSTCSWCSTWLKVWTCTGPKQSKCCLSLWAHLCRTSCAIL